jgi:hypothetical protein
VWGPTGPREGALAQLVARFHGMEEVRGSSPLSSTFRPLVTPSSSSYARSSGWSAWLLLTNLLTDEIVKIVLGCRGVDHPMVWLLASRGSSTAGHLCRSAGAVKMQRPTGRTILTVASTGASSKLEESRTTAEMRSANRCLAAAGLVGLPVGDEDLVGAFSLFGHFSSLRCVVACRCMRRRGCDGYRGGTGRRQPARACAACG